uniref:NAD(P)-dependent oxidoreductase EC-YbbO n=1 Tax=uncultured Thiotrichaceae bacterium TaxID=298394 RepID=A0A6S6U4K5_9GAMM|nr:MAG: Putative NAD(P)-dependent oxidoreductase EC-YbbO [uncultured Thiotrichaceae bacterium]
MRNVLITGCSSGIGYCVAKGLRERGYNVFVTARKEDDIKRLEEEGFKVIPLELSDPESVKDCAYELMLRANNDVYAVFHNGAYGQAGALEDISREVLEKQFAANVFGWHQLTNLLLPLMRNAGEGRIIYNSSVLGIISLPFRGSYAASKYALEGLADTLRLELYNTGIHVSLIEPGPVESDFRKNSLQALREHVDINASVHRRKYDGAIRRMEKEGPAAPFTLPPEAVLKKVIHALESERPRARYPVTFPTYLFSTLRRILPTRALDKVLRHVSHKERQES